jgi:hypothetical protein
LYVTLQQNIKKSGVLSGYFCGTRLPLLDAAYNKCNTKVVAVVVAAAVAFVVDNIEL